jgi:aspartate/methionine/tyrosine aminotransferase
VRIEPFRLERYFARYEFAARYSLCSSDCDGLALSDLLTMADGESRSLWEGLRLGYTESRGAPWLRQEIASLYDGVSPEDVMVLTPEEGILAAMNCLLQPGDHVVCMFPGYQSLYQVAESLGCMVSRWQPSEGEGWRFDPDGLEALIRPNTRLVVCNSPHNPTGYLLPRDEFERMLAIVRQHGLYLFSDEMYRFLELDTHDRLPAAVERYERSVSLFGMSKTFGLAGLRLGWLVTSDRPLMSALCSFKDYTTICNSAPSEVLALIALRARETIIRRHLERIKRNLCVIDEFMGRHRGRFSWVRPRAGTVAFPRLHDGVGASRFCESVIRDTGIMLLPSTVYDYGDVHMRLGFGRDNLPEAIAALDVYLAAH